MWSKVHRCSAGPTVRNVGGSGDEANPYVSRRRYARALVLSNSPRVCDPEEGFLHPAMGFYISAARCANISVAFGASVWRESWQATAHEFKGSYIIKRVSLSSTAAGTWGISNCWLRAWSRSRDRRGSGVDGAEVDYILHIC